MTNRPSRTVPNGDTPLAGLSLQKLPFINTDPEEEDEYFEYFSDEPGSIPGTLSIEADASPPVIFLIDYDSSKAVRVKIDQPEDCTPYLDSVSVSWVDVQGLGNEDVLRRIGEVFDLHPLMLEDVVNVPQRPKIDEYGDQVLLIARMVTPKENGRGFVAEQVSLILGRHYLLTVQEEPDYDCFGPVRERIRLAKGTIRQHGADYLAYALIDAIIDGFFPVLEEYGEALEELENEVVESPTHQSLEKIHRIRRELLALRRAIWPQRDAINSLIRDCHDLISDEVRVYLRDCYDHTVQVIDMVETYREVASSLMDVYVSSVGNRMNEVMKTLTIVSTIFIPLTFIAGVYGMNFNPDASPWNMPELEWYWGYPACLLLMLGVGLASVLYFKRRGWFENFSGIKD
ncbi:magnesium/cobalt transporter CorA [Leptolyngbya sp. NK1-12]|uniref:Magnesium transport protein CorA n=1 Tax=Leptolyngbya sp. NK1-12 TaxID=2547451 RepID=A0AA96WI47_9CYAN|nr:magnesium/cobalt transporter CorA [Leptolyngbya sp. NK1-12]MBF2046490.1 magnesium/cobalt transporter CorA [Elainella sp. C42_A2020_010]RNJ69785.1 MAG: magnesium and cobalt transport protein CorA [Leptolyngbya sp. IPPAS B-1204]WNZ25943.1 magnesium/cobalt transporter CorA [Leptolyngbya sp. NK1-12]